MNRVELDNGMIRLEGLRLIGAKANGTAGLWDMNLLDEANGSVTVMRMAEGMQILDRGRKDAARGVTDNDLLNVLVYRDAPDVVVAVQIVEGAKVR